MTVQDRHSEFIKDWEKKTFQGLNPAQQIQLLENAVKAVEQRACVTLSSITLLAILDRVLSLSKEQFPVLSEVNIEHHSLNFKGLHTSKDFKTDEIMTGLRFVLTELLRVFGRITANILTLPLYNEILSVTLNEPEKK